MEQLFKVNPLEDDLVRFVELNINDYRVQLKEDVEIKAGSKFEYVSDIQFNKTFIKDDVVFVNSVHSNDFAVQIPMQSESFKLTIYNFTNEDIIIPKTENLGHVYIIHYDNIDNTYINPFYEDECMSIRTKIDGCIQKIEHAYTEDGKHTVILTML